MADLSSSDDGAALSDEVDRLRALVGPSEIAYSELVDDVGIASELTKQAQTEAGELRGNIVELQTALARAQGRSASMPSTGLAGLWGRIDHAVRRALSRWA